MPAFMEDSAESRLKISDPLFSAQESFLARPQTVLLSAGPMPRYVSNKSLGIKRPPSAFALFLAYHKAGASVPLVRRLKMKTPPKLSRKELLEKWCLGLISEVGISGVLKLCG